MFVWLNKHDRKACRKSGLWFPRFALFCKKKELHFHLEHAKGQHSEADHLSRARAIMRVFWHKKKRGVKGFWGLMALMMALSLPGHTQALNPSHITTITFQDSSGTLIRTFAAPFVFKCSTGMTCAVSGNVMTVSSTGGGGGGTNYQTFDNAGVALTQRATANFFAGITCADNGGTLATDCTLTTVGATSHKWFSSVASGALVATQPASTDLSDFNSSPPGHAGEIPIWDSGSSTYIPGDPQVQGLAADGATTVLNPIEIGGYDTAGTPAIHRAIFLNANPAGTEYGEVVRNIPSGTQAVSGTVTTSPPANATTNVTQFGGTNVSTGTGTGGAGIPRVTVSSDSFPATQAVSGTVTANAGTNLNTSALALDTSVNGLLLAQGSTTSGQKGTLAVGAVTTGAPTYVTAQTSPLSLNTAGGLRVDGSGVTQPVSGTVTANAGSGTFAVSGTVTANAGSGNFTVTQATGTNLHAVLDTTSTTAVTQATAANLNATVVQSSGASLHVNCDSGCGGAAADTTASGTLGSLNAAVQVSMAGVNSASITLPSGNNLIGTLNAESSSDGGTTWQATLIRLAASGNVWASSVAVSSANIAYNLQVPGGASHVRIRVNPYTSGTATASLRATTQPDAVPDPLVQGTQPAASSTQPNPLITGGWDGAATRSIKTDNTGILQIGVPGTVTLGNLPQQPLFNTTDFNDVVAGSPSTGLIPYANATPKWTALTAATQGAAGGFFNEAQAVLTVPTAPTLTVSNTGGTITQASGTTVFVRVTLKNAFGETTGSTETSIAVSTGNGCLAASTTCSVVVTFVTGCTTGNATGCTVYDAITSLQENQQTASNSCVNIATATCIVGTVALTSTAYPPTVNTASNGTAVIPSFVSSTGASGAKVVMDSGATLTPCYLNGNPVAGSSCFPTLASCYGAIPSFGGTCIVAANQANGYYLETMAATLALNKNFAGFWFTVPAIITMGSNQVTAPGGTIGPFIRAGIPWSFNNPNVGGNPTGVVFNYTGTGTAFNLGATGGSDTNFMVLENIAVYISGAGSAAVGVDLQQVNFSQFPQLIIVGTSVGATTQVCLKMDGGSTFTGKNVFTNPNITGCKSDVQFNTNSIGNVFIGGTYSSGVTSAIGWDLQGPTANANVGVDIVIEGTPTAINFANTNVNQLNQISAFFETNTTDVLFGTGASGNEITVLQGSSGAIGATLANAIVTDNSGGNTNSVVDFINFQRTNAGLIRATGFTPMVAATGGLGTVALPFANGFFGTTATNNSELLPDAGISGARTVGMPDASLVLPFNLRVTADFVTAANTNLQTITGLSWVMPANTVRNQAFDCYLIYNQQTAAVANDAFGIQAASLAPTSINAQGSVQVAAATAHTDGNLTLLATTTATNIVAFTPSAITTVWNAEIHGMIENPSGVANTINVMAKTGTAADTLTVKRGSYCLIH